jgi:hypothetical protein
MELKCGYWTISENDRRSSNRDLKAAVSTGLMINESRTTYVKINRNVTKLEQDLLMDGQIFEVVQIFRILNTFLN